MACIRNDLTRELCERILDARTGALDARTVSKVKEAIRDGLMVGAAGSMQQPIKILAEYVRSLGANEQCSVWGHGFKTSAASAALINGASGHVLDYEPMSIPSTHVVSPVLPAVMALAESEGRSGRDIVVACAKGFELQHRLLYAVAQRPRAERKFHAPGVVGVMGAAAAAGHMLELNVLQLSHAIGMAASRAGSLLANVGSMTKCSHAGNAACAGVEAACLAKRGFTANAEILEHHQGYIEAFFGTGTLDRERLLKFGNPFRIAEPGMAYKFHPSKYPTHFGIEAALELHTRVPASHELKRIRVTTPRMPDVDRPKPQTGLDGKFSFQYTIAVALLDGRVGIESFSEERRRQPDLNQLLEKIELTQSPDIPTDFHKMHVSIEIETVAGDIHNAQCSAPRGFWGTTISPEDHLEKLRDCMQPLLSAREIADFVALTQELENADAAGVARLVGLMSGKGR